MTIFTVTLKLASPLLTGEPRRGNVYQSYSYLPGSVLRWAVAAALMAGWTPEQRQQAHPDECPNLENCDFCRVLYPRDAAGQPARPPRFYDCYPALPTGSSPAQSLPVTAQTCKRHPGFKRDDDPDEPHGVMDTLIRQAAAADAQKSGVVVPYVYQPVCPECKGKEPLEKVDEGYYGCSGDLFYTAAPRNRRFSRTAINRRRHTAQEGQLFTLAVMGEQMSTNIPKPYPDKMQTHLQGQVEVGDADEILLREALGQVSGLGSSSSRGLGQLSEAITITNLPPSAPPAIDLAQFQAQVVAGRFQPGSSGVLDLGSRLAAFNQAIQAERDFYRAIGINGVLPGRWHFTIDLLSDAFVRDGGLPALALTAGMLGLTEAKEAFTAVTPVNRGGWSNAWGLPRSRQPGIGAGSVFLFRVESSDAQTTAVLFNRLVALEQDGIGIDKERGAGHIQVCAPFHLEVNPR